VAGGSLVLVALGLVTLWEIASRLKIKGDAIAVVALLFPLLVYLVLSGQLTELSGPGGLNAKFRQASEQPCDVAAIEVSEAPLALEKASLPDLERWIKKAPDRSKPVLLTQRGNRVQPSDIRSIPSTSAQRISAVRIRNRA
jgi:hypothetical protein